MSTPITAGEEGGEIEMRLWPELPAVVAAVLLIAGSSGTIFAASQAATPLEKEPVVQKMIKHEGPVKAVDAGTKTVTVEEKAGEAIIAVTDQTRIPRGKGAVKLQDLKVGEHVTVLATQQEGKTIARSITISAH